MRWKLGIGMGLLLVLAVNALMVGLAIAHPPEIEPSYVVAPR